MTEEKKGSRGVGIKSSTFILPVLVPRKTVYVFSLVVRDDVSNSIFLGSNSWFSGS